jgi:HD-like signal output (HDOD) protein
MSMKKRVGKLLLKAELITQGQFDAALEIQKDTGSELIDILFSLGAVEPNAFMDFLLNYPGVLPSDIRDLEIDSELIEMVPTAMAREMGVAPVDLVGEELTLAAKAPLSEDAERQIAKSTGLTLKILLCSPNDVDGVLDRYYAESEDSGAGNGGTSLAGLAQPIKLSHMVHLVRGIRSLPALPETVHRVREAMLSPDSSVATVTDIITLDPPVAAKVLSVANSAAYGFSHKITDLNLAVSLMGLKETYAIVLSAAVVDLVSQMEEFDYRAFWLESVCSACAARIVAKVSNRRQLPGVFTAGLLHDVGRAALWDVAAEKCKKIDNTLTGIELLEAEQSIVGLTHVEAGYELALHWALPDEIAQAIRFHHQPELATEAKEHVAIVALSDVMVQASGSQFEDNPDIFAPHMDTLATLGLDIENAEAMLEEYLSRHEAAVQDTFG